MAIIKYKPSAGGSWTTLNNVTMNPINILQTTGTSTSAVMSQNAVTTELSAKALNSDLIALRNIVTGHVQSVAITTNTSSSCGITGAGNAGVLEVIVYTNNTQSDLTVTVPTTYKTPDGDPIELVCPSGGYCEVNYMNIGGTIYARGE